MFKKFSPAELASHTLAKSSTARNIRKSLLHQYPHYIDEFEHCLLPRKLPLYLIKYERMHLLVANGTILFFNTHDGPWMPTLAILHKYPDMLPRWTVDKGAIKFVLSGANIMCPGLTSPGGRLDADVQPEQCVAIFAEGKEHAIAIGIAKMSTNDVKKINKGVCVETMCYLGDGLWMSPHIETK